MMEGSRPGGATSLIENLDSRVLVVLRDGKHITGKLVSFDQYCKHLGNSSTSFFSVEWRKIN